MQGQQRLLNQVFDLIDQVGPQTTSEEPAKMILKLGHKIPIGCRIASERSQHQSAQSIFEDWQVAHM